MIWGIGKTIKLEIGEIPIKWLICYSTVNFKFKVSKLLKWKSVISHLRVNSKWRICKEKFKIYEWLVAHWCKHSNYGLLKDEFGSHSTKFDKSNIQIYISTVSTRFWGWLQSCISVCWSKYSNRNWRRVEDWSF